MYKTTNGARFRMILVFEYLVISNFSIRIILLISNSTQTTSNENKKNSLSITTLKIANSERLKKSISSFQQSTTFADYTLLLH